MKREGPFAAAERKPLSPLYLVAEPPKHASRLDSYREVGQYLAIRATQF